LDVIGVPLAAGVHDEPANIGPDEGIEPIGSAVFGAAPDAAGRTALDAGRTAAGDPLGPGDNG
jgi:hypothetical protein